MSTTAPASANSNKQLIDMLRRSRLFRDYESVFTKATGLPLALRPVDYWQLEHQGKKHENPFCALLAERPATLAVCLQAHDEMIRHTGDLPHTVTCPFGLTETAVPVKLGDKTIGYLRIGQVFRRATLGVDQPNCLGKTECRTAACAKGARVYRQAQNGTALLGGGRQGFRRECVPFL